MKVNELMIGDWVQDKYMHVRFQIFKISGESVNHAPHSDSGFLEEEIEPIPITPEILAKNGFENSDLNEWKYGDVIIDFYNDDTVYNIHIDNNSHVIDIESKYVHELQNALRLCKIEKEIEL